MTTILKVTSTPQTFTANTYAGAANIFNNKVWTFTFTPTAASTTYTGGNFHALLGQAHGGIWLNDNKLELYTTPGDALCFSQAITWSASQTVTVTVDTRSATRSVTIAGGTTGNGTFTFSQAGPYIDGTADLVVGDFTGGFTFAGTISSFDDTVPDSSWLPKIPTESLRRAASTALVMSVLAAPVFVPSTPVPDSSWQPSYPAHQLRAAPRALNVGGMTAPDAVLPNPTAPPMSWSPSFPDSTTRARAVVNVGGETAPVATLPNAPAPPLSWAPSFPDATARARGAPIVGGAVGPEAVIPNALPPGLSWAPTYPDFARRARQPTHHSSLTAPPFAGGKPLTVGAAAIRQNILGQLAFSTPLTTFGTDLAFTAVAGTDTLTTATHGMVLCAGPFQLSTTGTLPAGLDSTTLYYVAAPTATTFKLALTPALAKAGTVVDITDAGSGTHTLVRAQNTAPLYSTLLAVFARGNQSTSPNQATDSAGNTYTYMTGTPRPYDNFSASSFSVATAIKALGGMAHTWSASIGNIGGQQDEVVIGGLEIFGAPILQSSSIVERADGSGATITSGTVTTTAKALLVAIIAGNGNVNQNHVFTFLDGFTKVARVCAEGDVDPAGYIQIEVAVRLVDIKGTYSFRAQGTSSEGGQMALLAFQAVNADLQPFDWLIQQPDPPVRVRRGQLGGETAPPSQLGASVTPLSWSPTYPDRVRARPSVTTSALVDPISQDKPPTWLPSFPDGVRALRSIASSALVDPISQDRPPTWLPTFPDFARAPAARQQPAALTAPPVDTNAGPLTWAPVYPGRTTTASRQVLSGETAPVLVPTVAPLLSSWAPIFPDTTRRVRLVVQGGNAAPEATLPNAPAPDLSWAPVFPSSLSRARGTVITGGMVAPEATLPNAPVPIVMPAEQGDSDLVATSVTSRIETTGTSSGLSASLVVP